MQLPLLPYMSDWCCMGFAAYWHAKGGKKMWDEFKKAENFGVKFEKIRGVAHMRHDQMGRVDHNRFFGRGQYCVACCT